MSSKASLLEQKTILEDMLASVVARVKNPDRNPDGSPILDAEDHRQLRWTAGELAEVTTLWELAG